MRGGSQLRWCAWSSSSLWVRFHWSSWCPFEEEPASPRHTLSSDEWLNINTPQHHGLGVSGAPQRARLWGNPGFRQEEVNLLGLPSGRLYSPVAAASPMKSGTWLGAGAPKVAPHPRAGSVSLTDLPPARLLLPPPSCHLALQQSGQISSPSGQLPRDKC